ncbi:hypothetical protein PybrP1_010455 [[Pythium] brassicae (nom. inval.)]|nr:hypothetical protein PybrP1_010455 [[Pythium] brassicae (nom. inval.)]
MVEEAAVPSKACPRTRWSDGLAGQRSRNRLQREPRATASQRHGASGPVRLRDIVPTIYVHQRPARILLRRVQLSSRIAAGDEGRAGAASRSAWVVRAHNRAHLRRRGCRTVLGVQSTSDYSGASGQVSEYALRSDKKSRSGAAIYIDATEAGGMARVMDHSCDLSAVPMQRFYRRRLAVVVVATLVIEPGEEVTLSYGRDLWSTCASGSAQCVSTKA